MKAIESESQSERERERAREKARGREIQNKWVKEKYKERYMG